MELIAPGLGQRPDCRAPRSSDKTVRNHITSIFAKLEVENRSRTIVLARDAGFGKKAA